MTDWKLESKCVFGFRAESGCVIEKVALKILFAVLSLLDILFEDLERHWGFEGRHKLLYKLLIDLLHADDSLIFICVANVQMDLRFEILLY